MTRDGNIHQLHDVYVLGLGVLLSKTTGRLKSRLKMFLGLPLAYLRIRCSEMGSRASANQ